MRYSVAVAHNGRETEIKLAVGGVAEGRALLRRAGFRIFRRRVFERNIVLDTPGQTLRASGALLRVREAGGKTWLTYKGPAAPGKHKSREELETEIPSASPIAAIFERLGFRPIFRYEKYRAEYRQASGGGIATLDETPIGVYLELEGSPQWIDRAARRLGFDEREYITASYARLYLDWCARAGSKPGDMIFR